jgi:hypothetical protein
VVLVAGQLGQAEVGASRGNYRPGYQALGVSHFDVEQADAFLFNPVNVEEAVRQQREPGTDADDDGAVRRSGNQRAIPTKPFGCNREVDVVAATEADDVGVARQVVSGLNRHNSGFDAVLLGAVS